MAWKNCIRQRYFTPSVRGIGSSFQLAITAPQINFIGYGTATAQSQLLQSNQHIPTIPNELYSQPFICTRNAHAHTNNTPTITISQAHTNNIKMHTDTIIANRILCWQTPHNNTILSTVNSHSYYLCTHFSVVSPLLVINSEHLSISHCNTTMHMLTATRKTIKNLPTHVHTHTHARFSTHRCVCVCVFGCVHQEMYLASVDTLLTILALIVSPLFTLM